MTASIAGTVQEADRESQHSDGMQPTTAPSIDCNASPRNRCCFRDESDPIKIMRQQVLEQPLLALQTHPLASGFPIPTPYIPSEAVALRFN
jgi:hypothetical protein